MNKPGIDELLVAAALDSGVRQRLEEQPDELFAEYELSNEHLDLLRHPDHRLLKLFGAALARQPTEAPRAAPAQMQPHATLEGRSLPELALALTIVPCLKVGDGEATHFSYAVWVNPLPEGVDPASLPPPAGAALPGEPLTPLHAVIQLSAVQMYLPSGQIPVAVWASIRQSTNAAVAPPPESSGDPASPPFGSDLGAIEVRHAAAAVHASPPAERYDSIRRLLAVLSSGGAR